ncbi:PilN domain-containing protein [Schnuerera ultunensis]|uniref:PilN domain-containing protein n=1 Tax=Schnuerera ultunensis TaxID=45497 RepID=UPI000418E065|nr:PilN domain-containing protein [Schnuerera ultunensis]
MKDLNYFEPYIEKKDFHIDKQFLIYPAIILLSIFTIFYTIYNQVKIKKNSQDITKLRLIVEDERINKKLDEIKDREIEVVNFKESLDKIKLLDASIEKESKIDNYLLDAITSRMPEDVFFTSISIYTDSIEIIGNSKDRWSIAQLGKTLEYIDDFKEIFISNISSEEGYYNFILNINLKDVSEDEGDTNNEEVEHEEDDEAIDEE